MIARELLLTCRSPLLAGLDDVDVTVLAEAFEQVRFVSGVAIITQGEAARDVYVLLSGQVRLVRNDVEFNTLLAGAHFGEMGLIAGRVRAASVIAIDDVVALRLTDAAWRQLTQEHPRTALLLMQRLADKLAEQLVAMTDHAELLYDRSSAVPVRACAITVDAGDESSAMSVRPGTRLTEVLLAQYQGVPVVAAMLGLRPVSLSTPILADGRIEPITLSSWEGREVWRRSAGLLFLAAARRVAPDRHFSLAHSVGAGRIVRGSTSPALRTSIEAEMLRMAQAALPFSREQWTIEEARAHWVAADEHDAVLALGIARGPTVSVVGLAGTWVHAMGPLLPTTAPLGAVSLRLHPDGFVIEHGPAILPWLDGAGQDAAALEVEHPRFSSPMARDHERWLTSMGVDSIGAFNATCISGRVRDLIRNAEGFHEKHIGRIADTIAARGDDVRLITIAGPSSSGKTTFIKRLTVQLEVNGVRPVALSLDDYYVDRERTPLDDHGVADFEVLQALDTTLLQDHLRRILAGEAVATAHFDFKTGRSHPTGGPVMQLQPGEVLLIEGIHGLNPELVGDAVAVDHQTRIFVQPSLCLPFDALTAVMPADVRFIRRIVRDRHARGTSAQDNIQRWSSVRRGEGRHIFPHQHHADAVFDTSLAYEMSVLKVYGERYLLEVPSTHPAAPTAYRLRGLLDRFVAIYPDHVPPTSILREFIGGSGFEY